MSTPFDINVPVNMNEDVVLNMEDGSQVVGTPQELVDAATAGNIIGLHYNPAMIPDPNAPAPAADVSPNPVAAADPSATTGLDTSLAPTDTTAPTDATLAASVPADAPTDTETPAEDASEPAAEPADIPADPVAADTAKLDEDLKTLEADEASGQ